MKSQREVLSNWMAGVAVAFAVEDNKIAALLCLVGMNRMVEKVELVVVQLAAGFVIAAVADFEKIAAPL